MRDFFQVLPVALGSVIIACAFWNQPAGAQSPSSRGTEDATWSTRAALAVNVPQTRNGLAGLAGQVSQPMSNFQRSELGWTLAQGAEAWFALDPVFAKQLAQSADQALSVFPRWLDSYGQLVQTRGIREPVWMQGQPEALSMAVLGWIALDRVAPNPARRDWVARFGEGLSLLRHKDPSRYPFRAHVSFSPQRPDCPAYAPLLERQVAMVASLGGDPSQPVAQNNTTPTAPDEAPVPTPARPDTESTPLVILKEVGKAPGAEWVPEQSRQVQALTAASLYLRDPAMLSEAQSEALDIWTHLVVAAQIPYCFAPMPVGTTNPKAVSVTIDNFMGLYRATNSPIYAELAGMAAHWARGGTAMTAPRRPSEQAAIQLATASVEGTPAAAWSQLRDVEPPVIPQVMQAENGRAVQKAFELVNMTYPDGSPGQMARVGRENMFWMRFDVDREDDYFFHIVSLKSHLEGGLISVNLRIDGDKIIVVPMGGATDPYVDMELVDGPRPLRQGPHSFGIRFSGLLMTQPALLDSVVAWPVVERRLIKLPTGESALLLHNCSPNPARTSFAEIKHWPPPVVTVVDGEGERSQITRESDKRRHKEYIVMPPAGTAILQWRDS